MRHPVLERLEQFRLVKGPFATERGSAHGAFIVPAKLLGKGIVGRFRIIVDDGAESRWEHVSVSLSHNRLPTWDEMCQVKRLFWRDDETVVQYHPSAEEYVDMGEVLHLFRPLDERLAKPPPILVGF